MALDCSPIKEANVFSQWFPFLHSEMSLDYQIFSHLQVTIFSYSVMVSPLRELPAQESSAIIVIIIIIISITNIIIS